MILCSVNKGDNPTIKPSTIANAICLIELSELSAEKSLANNVNMSVPYASGQYELDRLTHIAYINTVIVPGYK